MTRRPPYGALGRSCKLFLMILPLPCKVRAQSFQRIAAMNNLKSSSSTCDRIGMRKKCRGVSVSEPCFRLERVALRYTSRGRNVFFGSTSLIWALNLVPSSSAWREVRYRSWRTHLAWKRAGMIPIGYVMLNRFPYTSVILSNNWKALVWKVLFAV